MKRIVAMLLVLCMALGLAACGQKTPAPAATVSPVKVGFVVEITKSSPSRIPGASPRGVTSTYCPLVSSSMPVIS